MMVSFQTVKLDLTPTKSGANTPPPVALFAWAGTRQWLRPLSSHSRTPTEPKPPQGQRDEEVFKSTCYLSAQIPSYHQHTGYSMCTVPMCDSVPWEEAGTEAACPGATGWTGLTGSKLWQSKIRVCSPKFTWQASPDRRSLLRTRFHSNQRER